MKLEHSVILLAAIGTCYSWSILDATSFTSSNGLDEGTWSTNKFCDGETFAIGFRIKHDGQSSKALDGVSQSGIEFLCATDETEYNVIIDEIPEGDWKQIYRCPQGEKVKGFQLNIKSNEGGLFGDQYGVQDTRILCEGLSLIDGLTGPTRKKMPSPVMPVIDDANWGDLRFCTGGGFMCGFHARLETTSSLSDGQGLTDLTLLCCTAE